MSIRTYTTILATVVITAVAVPGAAMGSRGAPKFTIHYTEPGSTGYLPQPKFSLPYTEPGSTGYVPVTALTAPAASSGFDWPSALIGAGAGLGVAVACAGGMTALRRRRGLAHA